MADVVRRRSALLPALIYAALSTAVISSLGLLLVPVIARELDVTVGRAQWMLTINLLVGAVATPILGRLSDGPSTKRLLMGTLLLILVGSVLAATANRFDQLLVGRAFQGLSYAVVPMTMTLLQRHAEPDKVRKGIPALSVTVATGLGVGYPLTGVISSTLDFHFAFWFAALFVTSAIVVLAVFVPADDRAALAVARRPFDFPGAVLLSTGLACLLLTISEGPTWHWTSARTLGLAAVALVLLAAWAFCELRSSHPLVRLDVLRHGDVLLANGTAIGLGSAMYIGMSVVSLVAQAPHATGYGIALPLFWAGFVMLPMSIGSQVASRASRLLVRRLSTTALLPIGAVFVTLSNGFLLIEHEAFWEIVIGMFVFGLGIGTTYAAMPGLISRSVVVEELGSAVSFNQLLRTVGGSVGSAVAGAILAAHVASTGATSGAGIDLAFAVSASACAVVAVLLLIHAAATARRRSTSTETPVAVGTAAHR